MADYRSRNQLILAEVEATPGTEQTPTPASNAIRVRQNNSFQLNMESLDTDLVQGGLDESKPITGGGDTQVQLPTYLTGAGGSGGTAPDYGALLKASAMSETLVASAVEDTAQAGAIGSITLHAGASATANYYRGMVISLIAGTGAGQTRVISAYNGTTKVASVYPDWDTAPDATTEFSIHACALYRSVSTDTKTLTLWKYMHRNNAAENSRRKRMKGGAGSFQIGLQPRQLATLDFTFRGQLVAAPDDVAKPSDPTYAGADPVPFMAAQSFLGGAEIKFSEFSLDIGASVDLPDDPSAAFGYDVAANITRRASGVIVPQMQLLSTRNAVADWFASTSQQLWLNWGPAAGKRISLYLPEVTYSSNEEADVRGFGAERCAFRSTAADAALFLCVH